MAELRIQQTPAHHQVRGGCQFWVCHFPYLLPYEPASCIHHPMMERQVQQGWAPAELPQLAHFCSVLWDVCRAAALHQGAYCDLIHPSITEGQMGCADVYVAYAAPVKSAVSSHLIEPRAVYLDLNNNKKHIVKAVSVLTVNHSHIITTARQP